LWEIDEGCIIILILNVYSKKIYWVMHDGYTTTHW